MWNSNMRKPVYERRIEKNFHLLSLAALAQVQGSFLYQKKVDTFFAPFTDYGSFFAKPNAFSKYVE